MSAIPYKVLIYWARGDLNPGPPGLSTYIVYEPGALPG